MVQFLLLVFTVFEVLEGPIHGGNELETSNCNSRHNEPCNNIIQHRGMCWCNNKRGSIFSAPTVLARLTMSDARTNRIIDSWMITTKFLKVE
jgi:hypothetical protein